MNIVETEIEGVVIVEPRLFEDGRGYFFESFSKKKFDAKVRPVDFVQDNESRSCYGVIRGLHYQMPPFAQSKLVRAVRGRILDVAVDIRKGSPTFGRHVAVELTSDNHRQLFVPRGFAHGFSVLSEEAVVQYKCDNYYSPQHEGSIAFDDPQLAIEWLVEASRLVISEKDRRHPRLMDAKLFDCNEQYYTNNS
jgi:dTDP-4-dehydrorhamnose 3,5-epimerase